MGKQKPLRLEGLAAHGRETARTLRNYYYENEAGLQEHGVESIDDGGPAVQTIPAAGRIDPFIWSHQRAPHSVAQGP